MPKQLDDCVKALIKQGKTEAEAWAICQASQNSEKPKGPKTLNNLKQP
jgi:hypothetical protein